MLRFSMADFIYHGSFPSLHIRYSFASTPMVAETAVLSHDLDPVAAHILGRSLNAAVLTMAVLGEGESYNFQWAYEGTVRSILINADRDGRIRGFVSPFHLDQAGKNEEELFGKEGTMTVIRTKNGKVINSSSTRSFLRDPVSDLGYFFSFSDQVETGIVSMIAFRPSSEHPVKLLQGWMFQAMPGCDPEIFDKLLMHLGREESRDLLKEDISGKEDLIEALGKLVSEIAEGEKPSCYDGPRPVFKCNCSREKMNPVIRALPREDREEIISKGEEVEINCSYCSRKYRLSIEECRKIWGED